MRRGGEFTVYTWKALVISLPTGLFEHCSANYKNFTIPQKNAPLALRVLWLGPGTPARALDAGSLKP